MSNIDSFVQGLSGTEIINDFLYQLEEFLKRDCNLTHVCSYEGGYYAKAKIEMKLHGIDTAVVDTTIQIGVPNDRPGVTVDETVEIPNEDRLDMVRERSHQPTPTMVKEPEAAEPVRQQRRYQKAVPHEIKTPDRGPGGATGEELEQV